jgi:hypothetical protein
MLSHSNLSWTASTASQVFQAQAGDCCVAFLPLSHIAEQMFTIHIPPVSGHQVLCILRSSLFVFVLFVFFAHTRMLTSGLLQREPGEAGAHPEGDPAHTPLLPAQVGFVLALRVLCVRVRVRVRWCVRVRVCRALCARC